MALKKSQLYSSLWRSCDELRGGMDASQYKDYVLTLLFMKYVSDRHAGRPDALIDVPAGGGFADIAALKGSKDIGEQINTIIAAFAKANDLQGVIDQADFDDDSKLGSGKDMQDRLSKLVAIFEGLDFRANRAGGDDLLGDAYEYLMRHFATESGKSKGQFYTPAEVSRVIAQVVGIGPGTRQDQTIYDPTCGSGSLLLKAADQAPRGITVYGQEMDNATWALARMNMILHGHETAEVHRGNTLAAPHFKSPGDGLKTFDFAVANPPFSAKAWSNGLDPAHDEFGRFEHGVPPARNGDYAFLLHLIASLKSRGKGAIILPHGVLFRGKREADIRRNLVRRGLVKGIIGLPPNLFYGTSIPACILVIDKENAHARRGIFMVDASRGFRKDGNKNRLRAQDIHRIVDVFNSQTEAPRYSRMVPASEIADPANDCNLNIPRYVDASEPEDLHDIDAHLNGGIPDRDLDALDAWWEVFPSLRATLFESAGRPGYSRLRVDMPEVDAAIRDHPEFKEYRQQVAEVFDLWRDVHRPILRDLAHGDTPADIIDALSENLLTGFAGLPLISPYDVYQRLLDYWDDVLQDDVHLVISDGWIEAARPRPTVDDKHRQIKETPDLTVQRRRYKMDLVPPPLIVARWFAAEQAEIDSLRATQDAASQALEAFVEEHMSAADWDDDPLAAAVNDKGRLTKAGVTARVLEVEADPESHHEMEALLRCLALMDAEAAAGRAVKTVQAALDTQVLARYETLTEAEIKTLAVDDKWFGTIRRAVDEDIQRLVRKLGSRVKKLQQRYAHPLPALQEAVTCFTTKVTSHLRHATMQQLLTGQVRLDGFDEEWQKKRIGDICTFLPTANNPRSDLAEDGDIAYIHYGDIHAHPESVLDCTRVELPRIEAERVSGSAAYLIDGDLVMVDASEDLAGVGKSVEVRGVVGHKVVAGLHTILCRSNPDEWAIGFKAYLQYIPAFASALSRLAAGTSVYAVSAKQLASVQLRLPAPFEQEAIVSVLSDMDAEIAALEQRLDKTRAVKQGMMQQLLTGRVRLVEPEVAATAP